MFCRIIESLGRISQNVDLGNASFGRFTSQRVMTEIRDLSSDTEFVIGLSLINDGDVIKEENIKTLKNESHIVADNIDVAIILPKIVLQGHAKLLNF